MLPSILQFSMTVQHIPCTAPAHTMDLSSRYKLIL